MKPKDKAKELVDKFTNNIFSSDGLYYSKLYALICVDEMIKLCWLYDECESYDWKYYNKVKQEIEKL